MIAVVAVIGLGLGSWLLRSLFILVIPAERLPHAVRDGLTHLAPAALAALVTVELVDATAGLSIGLALVAVGATALAGLAARRTGSMLLAVGIGLAAALVIDLVMLG